MMGGERRSGLRVFVEESQKFKLQLRKCVTIATITAVKGGFYNNTKK